MHKESKCKNITVNAEVVMTTMKFKASLLYDDIFHYQLKFVYSLLVNLNNRIFKIITAIFGNRENGIKLIIIISKTVSSLVNISSSLYHNVSLQ
jgi:hypothetical protein